MQQQQDGKADNDLGYRQRDHEEREALAHRRARVTRERDEVDVDGVHHELDGDQHADAVALREDAEGSDRTSRSEPMENESRLFFSNGKGTSFWKGPIESSPERSI